MQKSPFIVTAMSALVMLACGEDRAEVKPPMDGGPVDGAPVTPDERARMCPPAQSAERIPQRLAAAVERPSMEYSSLAGAINTACGGCHVAPTANGNFMFQNAYAGSEIRVSGSLRFVPGLSEVADKLAQQLVGKVMPPANIRDVAADYYDQLGVQVQDWISAGKPNGSFELSGMTMDGGLQLPSKIAAAVTDIGDCIPKIEIVGHDPDKDAAFEAMTSLPPSLTDTDLVSMDAYELARRGTVSFAVEYPLWADNARKGRWIHTPSTTDGAGHAQRTAITYNAETKQFSIPDNTRFYKTFYKEVREADAVTRYRKVETRLIVVRHAPREPLFGTYIWDSNETTATLHQVPYRSGAPFKDLVLDFEVDELTHRHRKYAVPAAHRCRECHDGSESDSFVLGFTPLQINRRPPGEGGHKAPIEADELGQLERLVSYGVIAGMTPPTAPKLEDSAGATRMPRNDYELRVQGYTAGNCGHCHNPKGFATKQNKSLTLNFLPGGTIFQMGRVASVYSSNTQIVAAGNPATSMIYRRVLNQSTLEGLVALQHMPAHTPGIDCNAVQLFGQWITSIPSTGSLATPAEIEAALAKAGTFQTACVVPADISWLEEDFTEPPVYAPRRGDWATAMPSPFRALEFTAELQTLAATEIATGFWLAKATCKFPSLDAPPGGTRPWMFRADGSQLRPFGEVYVERPGSYFFRNVCSKCHGEDADGQSGIARTILTATGGATRVANLHDGLFRSDGSAIALFQDGARNFAGNYLIWMAMGGTQAFFPPSLEAIVGTHGANMLNLVRVQCSGLLPNVDSPLREGAFVYETTNRVCTHGNPITPDTGYKTVDGKLVPIDEAVQKAWLDRAAQNAGWMIFRYLRDELATGNKPVPLSECERVYPAP